jgi:cystathionine beta-lyase family protein involved in aluminum resistance
LSILERFSEGAFFMMSLTPATVIQQAEQALQSTVFPTLEAICHQTTARVVEAFRQAKIGEEHFYCVTGYGHNDLGRVALDTVFAHALQAEAALVRPHIVSGTHAIALGLRGCLSRNELLLSVTGSPYDTLEEVIGIRGSAKQSLTAQGVRYEAIQLLNERCLESALKPSWSAEETSLIEQANVLYIQRSRGYSTRDSLSISTLEALIARLRSRNPNAIVFVDNCYGEFVEPNEPTAVGADLMAGSLIKNPGGGIALTGGYVAGKQVLINEVADCLTCPGIGAEGGYLFNQTRLLLQGLFLAPSMVKEALKGMVLAACLFEQLGIKTLPASTAVRSDIIQTVFVGNPEKLKALCRTIQAYSPVNSYLTPDVAHAPGYDSALIMAGGTFIDGSSIELSADAPLREPYCLYLQGGLNYSHTRLVLEKLIPLLQ